MLTEKSTLVEDLLVITPEVFHDFRGEYVETWNSQDYQFRDADGNPVNFLQDDISVSRKDVLRGLHGDSHTWKLISCLQGAFYFVVVDCRVDSPTYKKHFSITLNDKNRKQVLVPAGCANGHLCLTDTCIFHYKQSGMYDRASQFSLLYTDMYDMYVFWPISNPILSERDRAAKTFEFLPKLKRKNG